MSVDDGVALFVSAVFWTLAAIVGVFVLLVLGGCLIIWSLT